MEEQPSFDVLLAAVCFLMSRYVNYPNTEVIRAMLTQLEMLVAHPDNDSDVLKGAVKRLACQLQKQLNEDDVFEQILSEKVSSLYSHKLH